VTGSAALAVPAPAVPTVGFRTLLGVVAVLLGAFISTINVRFTTAALADIRGGLSLGFDEGSWFATAHAATQLAVCASATWLSIALGPRRFMLWSSIIFCVASLLPPLTRDPALLLAIQIVRGLAVGTFIPSSISFVLRALPPRLWAWGLGAYAFRFVFSQNITASIEAFYAEHGLWAWMFWQNTALTAIMIVLIWFGMPRQPIDRTLLRQGDWTGIVLVGLGLTLVYAGLDQGNRLDWLNSGVVVGLLAGGGLLLVAFAVHEQLIERPLIDFKIMRRLNYLVPTFMIGAYTFGTTATSFVLPNYLMQVQNLRALQISDTLNWIALPQIALVPLVAWLLRYLDARLLLATCLALVAIGSWMDTGLTHDWAGGDFLPAQLVEAVGLALGITSLIFFTIANITPAAVVTVAGMIQTSRLLGAETGSAFIQTFLRMREQIHSNLIGLNVSVGDSITERAAAQLSQAVADRAGGAGDGTSQGLLILGNLVRREAFVLAYIDAFWIVAWVLAASLVLLLFLSRPPPNYLTPPRVQ
jgi:MFS transporter, DHA2 family, multidrug resistance protein